MTQIAFTSAVKPEVYKASTDAFLDRSIVLKCVQRAIDELTAQPENEQTRIARKRLFCGSIKRSKVDGVNSVPTLLGFVQELQEPSLVVLRPNTKNPLLKFLVPPQYRAFTPLVRIKDLELETRGRPFAYGISPCVVRRKTDKGVVWEHKLHAKNIFPIRTESVTFILTPDWDNLVEWFAGEDPNLWEPTGDLGSQWVYLGVDLVEENIRKNRRTYGPPRNIDYKQVLKQAAASEVPLSL